MVQKIGLVRSWAKGNGLFAGPVEVDETYIGGREHNKHSSKKLGAGRGPVGKTAVVGAQDRRTNLVSAAVVQNTDAEALQTFVSERVATGAAVYTNDHAAYRGLRNHSTVKHSVGEYVRDQAHTNSVESFWSMLKRGYYGTYHRMSEEHLNRHVAEFEGRHNQREHDTLDQMYAMMRGMVGKHLPYQDLLS